MFETLWQIPGEPLGQCIALSSGVHEGNTVTNFRNRHDADKGAVFVKSIQPFENAAFGARLCHF
ncbi:hypothetical protein N181_29305 [Sinorhizobium fredii USDA 205]|nr:hypothetical protein N181_29305 [Sinorhizobium fredii USDA 205]GLS08279.1 hypothetical protein GCM10007864_19080 [Sinorhizobium fredii]